MNADAKGAADRRTLGDQAFCATPQKGSSSTRTPDCLLCERPDETGGYLCRGCTKDTRVRLECLPDLYVALAAFLIPAVTGTAGRGATRAHSPMPVAELPLTMRGPGGMVGVTEDWLTLIREERGMAVPPLAGAIERRLRDAVTELWHQLPWIAVSWPMAGTFAEEIRELADAARSVIAPRDRPNEVRVMRLGNCPALIEDGSVCGAVLNRHPGEQVVRCLWCSASYSEASWYELKAAMDQIVAAGAEMAEAGGAG